MNPEEFISLVKEEIRQELGN